MASLPLPRLWFLAVPWLLCHCSTLSYYGQATAGQIEIMAGKKPMARLLADDQTAPPLKKKLRLILEILDFAEQEMVLPAQGNYRHYIDLKREHVVWSVFAAPEFSLEAKTWWYPVVGSLSYRGFFAERNAESEATKLRENGYDAWVAGIDAYSTLGWFRDPVLNTFIDYPESSLVSLICHELTHRLLYEPGDTPFNEAFAVCVEQEAERRWHRLKGKSQSELADRHRLESRFRTLLRESSRKLERLYEEHRTENLPADRTRIRKQAILSDMKHNYQKIKERTHGRFDFDHWFDQPVNNGLFVSLETYHHLVPGFEALLAEKDGDLPAFYGAVRELASLQKEERHRILENLAVAHGQTALKMPSSQP
ncbi:MAG: aminopeptidase [Verrucomicrobiota bacterium]